MAYEAASDRYSTMNYNRCGSSGLLLPALSLGLWHNFGAHDPFENSRAMVLRAFDLGVTHFDLANNYGPPPGAAEETFGRILADDLRQHRDEIVISTKAGYHMWPGPYGEWGSRKSLVASLDQSLKRLRLDYVDIYYHHRPDPGTPMEETMDALAAILRQGKALYVGVSNYTPGQLEQAAGILNRQGVHLLISQMRYSMFNRVFENGEQAAVQKHGMGAIAFCPLAEGLLTSRYFSGIPKDSRAAGPSVFLKESNVTPERIGMARALDRIAQDRGQTLAQMALAWALANPAVTSLIIGASRVSQIEENIRALENCAFAAAETEAIEQILKDNEPFY